MSEIRCQSPICLVKDQVRGRMFTPPTDAKGITEVWCPECIKVTTQMQFFSQETAEMIRNTYKSYIDTNLPKETKLFLQAYTQEIMKNLGAEL